MQNRFKLRIFYKDTDAEGVVYYANYLGYFEQGRTELLRQMGVNLKELKEKQGIVFAVTKVECDYKAPAQYDDELLVTTEIKEKTPVRIIFKQEVLRGENVLVSALITLCAISLNDFKPTRLPAGIA
ncbi:MAG: tol-pal system-associated acyl-CoA thioesterase [Candidatus Margulisbacteria bacterium]|nr:tol-pal system-associated acyl-CoA thioesterase [Candidatus Margulisiibacteriota bacterium]